MKLIKRFNAKRMLLIGIALGVFLIGLIFLAPFILGMGKGYDAAMIENKIKKQCRCKTVKSIKVELNEEIIVDDIKRKKHSKSFLFKLSDCDYFSFEDLKSSVLNVLVENNVCETRTIQFVIEDFKGEEQRFEIVNCNINNN